VKFWDSSAIVPLLVPEVMSGSMRRLYEIDAVMVVWWGTEIECTSAVARRHRAGGLPEPIVTEALGRLSVLSAGWHEVEAVEDVRQAAKRLVRVHDLRTAGALQLAAALFTAEGRPATLQLVSLDDRLVAAARREGFSLFQA
jgi:predicted nucleic acid-binding protein